MIVDSSALLAILAGEPDAERFATALATSTSVSISAGTLVETSIVVDSRRDPVLSARLDELLLAVGVIVEPVTASQATIARQAYRDFGRGSGHPAGLNFGDCFAYALAKDASEPLLFKGADFAHTDLRSALLGLSRVTPTGVGSRGEVAHRGDRSTRARCGRGHRVERCAPRGVLAE